MLITGVPMICKNASSKDPFYKYFVNRQEDEFWKLIQRKLNRKFPSDIITLINGMVCNNEDERSSLTDIFQNKWVQQEDLMEK